MLNDLPQMTASIEEIRIFCVRLGQQNRLLNLKCQPIVSPSIDRLFNKSTTREVTTVNDPNKVKYFRIDERGRRFHFQKKVVNDPSTSEKDTKIPCRRKRPTHRGKRKKDYYDLSILKKSITTFSQLCPTAQQLPKGLMKLPQLLYGALDEIHTLLGNLIRLQQENQRNGYPNQPYDSNNFSSKGID